MADMKIVNNKVAYVNSSGDALYNMPIAGGSNTFVVKTDGTNLSFSDELPYTPNVAANWNVAPTYANNALDEAAARIKVLETQVTDLEANVTSLAARVTTLEGA